MPQPPSAQPPSAQPPVTAAQVPGLPALYPVLDTPAGASVFGFTASGEEALDWWRRLREAHPVTGCWPVLTDGYTPEHLAAQHLLADLAGCLAEADTLDGAGILAGRGTERLRDFGPELAAVTRAELRGEGRWPADPERPGFRLPFTSTGAAQPVIVALVPAAAGWQVPAVLGYDGGNRYPRPAEHVAILRYWHRRFGADLVAMTDATVEFAVSRPPDTRSEALALAWEYFVYNDGYYDFYYADDITDLAASLIDAPVWLAWWD